MPSIKQIFRRGRGESSADERSRTPSPMTTSKGTGALPYESTAPGQPPRVGERPMHDNEGERVARRSSRARRSSLPASYVRSDGVPASSTKVLGHRATASTNAQIGDLPAHDTSLARDMQGLGLTDGQTKTRSRPYSEEIADRNIRESALHYPHQNEPLSPGGRARSSTRPSSKERYAEEVADRNIGVAIGHPDDHTATSPRTTTNGFTTNPAVDPLADHLIARGPTTSAPQRRYSVSRKPVGSGSRRSSMDANGYKMDVMEALAGDPSGTSTLQRSRSIKQTKPLPPVPPIPQDYQNQMAGDTPAPLSINKAQPPTHGTRVDDPAIPPPSKPAPAAPVERSVDHTTAALQDSSASATTTAGPGISALPSQSANHEWLVKDSATVPNLEGIVNLQNTADTTVSEKWAPAVTHETVHHDTHEQVTYEVTREIHNHDVFHRVLPIIDVQVLPARHFLPLPPSPTSANNPNAPVKLVEVPAASIPGATGQNYHWLIAETVTKHPRTHPMPKEPRRFTARTWADGEGTYKQYVGEDGVKRTEQTWVHPPILNPYSKLAGETVPVIFGDERAPVVEEPEPAWFVNSGTGNVQKFGGVDELERGVQGLKLKGKERRTSVHLE